MSQIDNDDRQSPRDAPARPGPLGYVAAAVLAVPVGAVAWFELVYFWFGFTDEDPPAAFNTAAVIVCFGVAFGWPLYGTHRVAEVVRRGCRLGILVALLLPVVAFAVLLLWENASGRRDLGMGGLLLYNLPFIALGVGAVLAIAFGIVGRLAGRKLQGAGGGSGRS